MAGTYQYYYAKFYESDLEAIAMDFMADQKMGYEYQSGSELHRAPEDVVLENDLKGYLRSRYKDLSANELESIMRKVKSSGNTLYETNRAFLSMLSDGFIQRREDPSKMDLYIQLINFEQPEANIFRVVNQLEVKQYQRRIPDAVAFINGLPVVVFEFKNPVNDGADTHEAYKQVTVRYRRDIPKLLGYNVFTVLSDGVNSKYGSVFAPYKFFNTWRQVEAGDPEVDGVDAFYALLEGLMRKDRLVALIKNFVFFPDALKQDDETKIIARPPQFFAATKLIESIKAHMKPAGDGKGGTYFGTTGCGKSYTMLFLTRMLMKDPALSSPTVLLITDRTDLDDQLSAQFLGAKNFIGDDEVVQIATRDELRERLADRKSGGVYLTTIQKFTEAASLLTDRANVICISDEAHRSQANISDEGKTVVTDEGVYRKFGFAKYLRDSLPNATYVGFTGTPVDDTINVFGEVVDAYTMVESVADGFTVNLVYEGRAAYVNLDQGKVKEIEDYYARCEQEGANTHQIEESKKATTHLEVILGDEDRLAAVARDFVAHYEKRIEESATVNGKAMFVCSNRFIAYGLYKAIEKLRPEWTQVAGYDEEGLTAEERRNLKPIERMKLVMTRGKDDPKEMYDMLGTDEDRKEFARQFKSDKSNFKIAIVVDMWLTGFDVPSLDTIYIDKPIQKHSLIQAVSRVNRVYEGKARGLIVDYIGIKKYLNEAVKTYTGGQTGAFDGVEKAAAITLDRLELIETLFRHFDASAFFGADPKLRLQCLNKAAEYIQLVKELEDRFMALARDMRQAYGLCSTSDLISKKQHARIDFYIAVRSVVFKLNKGDAPDISEMNDRVRELLEEAIKSTGVEEVFVSGQNVGMEEDLFDEAYLKRIQAMELPNTKIKLLERLLKRDIEAFRKVNKLKATDFSKRLRDIINNYNDRTSDEGDLSDILESVTDQLVDLVHDLVVEKHSFEGMGIDYEEKAFYDILKATAEKYDFEYPDDKLIDLSRKVKQIVADKSKYTDWSRREDIKAELKVDLIILLDENGYPPVPRDEVYKDVFEQAENFKKYDE